jgi:hypothetical protein
MLENAKITWGIDTMTNLLDHGDVVRSLSGAPLAVFSSRDALSDISSPLDSLRSQHRLHPNWMV